MKNTSAQEFDINQIKAVIGLGNPGARFDGTRHNIGFSVVDELARRLDLHWRSSDLMDIASGKILLIKPQTYMNTSGRVIPYLLKKGIRAENIVVVHDELEKKFGTLALRQGGSARGHNGLRSIMGVIGADFWRLRCGIDRPEDKSEVGNYVLQKFTPTEQQELEYFIDSAADLFEQPQNS